MKAVVESISIVSIIVKTAEDKVITLTGSAIQAIAPTLKLGNEVEFDSAENLTTIRVLPAPKATTTRKTGQSPAYAFNKPFDHVNPPMSW